MIKSALNPKALWREYIFPCYVRCKRYISKEFFIGNDLKVKLSNYGSILLIFLQKTLDIPFWAWIALFIVALVSQVYSSIISSKAIQNHDFYKKELEKALDELDKALSDDIRADYYRKKVEICLQKMLESLNLKRNPHIRVSLYTHDPSTQNFNLITRYSDHPEFTKRNRALYPDTGFIGQSWRQNECHADNFSDPMLNRDQWIKEQLERGFTQDEKMINSLSMFSRQYYGIVVRNNLTDSKIGVLIFESIIPNTLRVKDIKNLIQDENGWLLSELLKRQEKYLPDTSFAKNRGL